MLGVNPVVDHGELTSGLMLLSELCIKLKLFCPALQADEDVPEASFSSSDESEPEMDSHARLLLSFAGADSAAEDSSSSDEKDDDENSSDMGEKSEEEASDNSLQKAKQDSDTVDDDVSSDEFEGSDASLGVIADPDHKLDNSSEEDVDEVEDNEDSVDENCVSDTDSLDVVDGTLSRMKRKDKVKVSDLLAVKKL